MSNPAGSVARVAEMRQLVEAYPFNAPLRFNLGVALQDAGDIEDARFAYETAVRLQPDFFQAWNNLGLIHEDAERFADAAAAYRTALSIKPDYSAGLRNLGRVAKLLGDLDTLRACNVQLARIEPDNWQAHLGAALSLPGVHVEANSIAASRERLAADLRGLIILAQSSRARLDERIRAIEKYPLFFVAYHGEDDRELQCLYARLVRVLLGEEVPECTTLPDKAEREGRLRVAFASCFFRDCTVGHYFKSWITDLSPVDFEVWIFLLGGGEDQLTNELRQVAYKTVTARGRLTEVAQLILEAAPDVLIYPELGMNGLTYALAALRLAPVQCVAWGHPVTSGHPTIDYFFSSVPMEPVDGAKHYSEKLVCLPGLGTRYEMPAVGAQFDRKDFDLPASAHLYLFPHGPYKIHPENDAVVAEVLANDPEGYLVMCEGLDPDMNRVLLKRLQFSLTTRGVLSERLIVMPHMTRSRYLELNRICDVMLDTSRWSGGNTSLDALAAGLPIVTQRGRFMRGRQTAAMLDMIGISDLVAESDAEYICVALKLGCDKTWHEQVCERIRAGRNRLFADQKPLAALEQFLLSVGRRTS